MKKFLLFIFISSSYLANAQTETSIRTHYTDVNKKIAESIEHGFEGSLYNNHWETNKNGKSWPAVGLYNEITDYWYDDSPDHISAVERNPKNVLLKVNIHRKASDYTANEEFLYKDGKLLFYFCQEGGEGNVSETRTNFNNKGIMFKSSVKANDKELTAKDFSTEEYKDLKPNAVKIMNSAKKYQDLFVKSM